jgi:hypothetical protein
VNLDCIRGASVRIFLVCLVGLGFSSRLGAQILNPPGPTQPQPNPNNPKQTTINCMAISVPDYTGSYTVTAIYPPGLLGSISFGGIGWVDQDHDGADSTIWYKVRSNPQYYESANKRTWEWKSPFIKYTCQQAEPSGYDYLTRTGDVSGWVELIDEEIDQECPDRDECEEPEGGGGGGQGGGGGDPELWCTFKVTRDLSTGTILMVVALSCWWW